MEVEPAGPTRRAIRGEVDLSNADHLEEILLARVSEASPDLTLDLAALSFMDSTGIRTLLRVAKALVERGGRLVLESPSRWFGACSSSSVSMTGRRSRSRVKRRGSRYRRTSNPVLAPSVNSSPHREASRSIRYSRLATC
jgi:hypothetical protein